MTNPRLAPLAVGLAVLGTAGALLAAPTNVTFEGKIELPPGGVKEPELGLKAFVERTPNAITDIKPYDPRPSCFVALEGGPAAADAAAPAPRAVVWTLTTASFSPPLLPVVTGSKVQIKNSGSASHAIFADAAPDLLGAEPIGPGGERTVVAKETGKALVIRARNSPHVEARLVAVPSKYFSRLKKDGSYAIPDVPPGKWTVRVWCLDGWVSSTKVVEVSRGARGDLVLPERVDQKAPVAP